MTVRNSNGLGCKTQQCYCPLGRENTTEAGTGTDSRWLHRCWPWIFVTLLAVLALIAAADDSSHNVKAAPSGASASTQEVQLRGRVVCLPEEMHKLYRTDLPTQHNHLYGFKTNDGVFYTLLRTKWSEALFVDQRLREKELLLTGRVLPKTQIFDVSRMKSVRNGVVCDLYYYCTLCDIQSVSPAECACCQGPVELVEKPL